MTKIKLNEQIAFLRKQKGLTQEELANALGVTNQAVSKWESAQCCPDILLLPDLAKIFDVSIDELVGYKSTEGLGNICLKIKDYFSSLPEKKVFENAAAAFLKAEEVETALREIPVTVKEEKGVFKYRLDGASSYLPALLSFFYKW